MTETKITENNTVKDNVSADENINFQTEGIGVEDIINEAETLENEPDEVDKLVSASLIDINEQLAPAPVAMQIMSNGELITLFTKGNFSIITGPAKSRKTFFVSLLAAAALCGHIQDMLVCEEAGSILVFDTEQTRYKTQQISNRIKKLSGCDDAERLRVYSLRTLDPVQRKAVIKRAIEKTPNISYVIIDGIIDLDIDPILQADQAHGIVSDLMKWTETYGIHITCVLHFNKKDSTLLGHLGSFSHRKADAIISVKKSPENERISIVEPVDCREKEFQSFAFTVNENGLPFILEYFVSPSSASGNSRKFSPEDVESVQHYEIIRLAFGTNQELGYEQMWKGIKTGLFSVFNQSGDNLAKAFLKYYKQKEMVVYESLSHNKAIYKPKRQQVDTNLFQSTSGLAV